MICYRGSRSSPPVGIQIGADGIHSRCHAAALVGRSITAPRPIGGPSWLSDVTYVTVMRADIRYIGFTSNREPVMAKHVEREQTDQLTELSMDETDRVAGGFITVELKDVKISSYSTSGHDSSPVSTLP